MPHDVFISYATKDKRIADAACAAIEARGFPLLDGSPRPAAGRPAKVRSLRGSRRIIDHIRLDTPWIRARHCTNRGNIAARLILRSTIANMLNSKWA